MLLRRPLRTAFLGDPNYTGAYRMGVAQGTTQLGGLHRDISFRQEMGWIDRQMREIRPDLVFTHMLAWPPRGAADRDDLLALCTAWRRAWGAKILLHDGDPKEATRYPEDLSAAVDLALCNHRCDRSAWKVPTLYWPYAAFAQHRIAAPNPELACKLAFAGRIDPVSSMAADPVSSLADTDIASADTDLEAPGLYTARSACLRELEARGVLTLFPRPDGPWVGLNTRLLTAELAASADAVLGFGRDVPGWIDTRVFEYPGAGGILLHDDVGSDFTGLLPDEHYLQVDRYSADSIMEQLDRLRGMEDEDLEAMRTRAFRHVQGAHTWLHRVLAVLAHFGLELGG